MIDLDDYERDLLESVESGEWVSRGDIDHSELKSCNLI